MKKLEYKGVRFESFEVVSDGNYYHENLRNNDIEIEEAYSYICPYCIAEKGFYKETNLSIHDVEDMISEMELNGEEEDDYVCCAEGCYHRKACNIDFIVGECKIID